MKCLKSVFVSLESLGFYCESKLIFNGLSYIGGMVWLMVLDTVVARAEFTLQTWRAAWTRTSASTLHVSMAEPVKIKNQGWGIVVTARPASGASIVNWYKRDKPLSLVWALWQQYSSVWWPFWVSTAGSMACVVRIYLTQVSVEHEACFNLISLFQIVFRNDSWQSFENRFELYWTVSWLKQRWVTLLMIS